MCVGGWLGGVGGRRRRRRRGDGGTWTHDSLTCRYQGEFGDSRVIIEHKFESEETGKSKMLLGDYLARHNEAIDDQQYVISELPSPMYEDVSVPSFLRCGTQQDKIVEVDLWVSNGGNQHSGPTRCPPTHRSFPRNFRSHASRPEQPTQLCGLRLEEMDCN